MSRTYKTQPWKIRMFNHKDHGVEAEARHDVECELGTSECDLPEYGKQSTEFETRCLWLPTVTKNQCGCPMCTMSEESKAERRASRRSAKVQLKRISQRASSLPINMLEGDSLEDLEGDLGFVETPPKERYIIRTGESFAMAEARRAEWAEKEEKFRQLQKLHEDNKARESVNN